MAVPFEIRSSAPGKVLLTGAYLILDKQYEGLVVGVDARVHSRLSRCSAPEICSQLDVSGINSNILIHFFDVIQIHSPQLGFTSSYVLFYGVQEKGGPFFGLHPLPGDCPHRHNPYFAASILFTCSAVYGLILERIFCEERKKAAPAPIPTLQVLAAEQLHQKFIINHNSVSLSICIEADNHFYSQHESLASRDLPRTAKAFDSLPNFLPATYGDDGSIQKTGLGSSAALVVSFVSSLVAYFDVYPETMKKSPKDFIHPLCQLIHCFAQGKIGSGFDVSSAVFGSQTYRRFSPELLSDIISQSSLEYNTTDSGDRHTKCTIPSPSNILRSLGISSDGDGQPEQQHSLTTLAASSNTKTPKKVQMAFTSEKALELTPSLWENLITLFPPPPEITLLLADIKGGSNTPSMVRKVLNWRSEQSEQALKLWTDLNLSNNLVANGLRSLCESRDTQPDEFSLAMNSWINPRQQHQQPEGEESSPVLQQNEKKVHILLNQIQDAFQTIRKLLKEMGEASDVPIEPPEQTQLIDATMKQPGVIISGVPGAGGFDSLFVLVRSNPVDVERVVQLWSNWPDFHVLPVNVHFDSDGLRVKHCPPCG